MTKRTRRKIIHYRMDAVPGALERRQLTIVSPAGPAAGLLGWPGVGWFPARLKYRSTKLLSSITGIRQEIDRDSIPLATWCARTPLRSEHPTVWVVNRAP